MISRPNPAEHVKLARWVANRYLRRRPWLEHLREDLVSAAMAELCEAARHYDPARGAWSSLAVVAAEHAIMGEVRRIGGPVRTPNGKRTARAVSADEERGWQSDAFAAHEMRGASREEHANAPRTLLDVLADDAATPEQEAAASEAPGLLARLSEREREVVLRRFSGETLEEIGETLELTRERVRQIEARALARIRLRVEKEVA